MGGKAKQSQRTKNNARPSSSGRSAELLNNVIKTDDVFGMLYKGKTLPTLFPTMTPIIPDHTMTNEFALAFKKLNKKDPITRTKALQELLELVNNSDTEEVVAILPSWGLFYVTLTIDTDHKVRELTQSCHSAIMERCGRRVAPQLKRLLPAWLLAVHDEHAPARSIASNCLKTTFPDQKLNDAITFCKSEIMALIVDNITGNAEAILNKKVEDPDERKVLMARIISSSLQAFCMFLDKILEYQDWVWEEIQTLLNNPAIWKLSANDSHHVRAAWFDAIGRIIQRHHTRLGPQLGGKMATILISQPEKRADVAASRWAALLLLLHVEEWHIWLKKKDLLVKRLFDTIENGGWGDVSLLSNILLPLISKLPDEFLTRDFYTQLFKALFTGLELKTILSSKSERQLWITNIADCLRYLSIQKYDFVTEIVALTHRSWLEKIFTIQDYTARVQLLKHSSNKMASIVKYWIKQFAETKEDVYDKLTRNYWQNFGMTVVMQIERLPSEEADVESLVREQTVMFTSLKVQNDRKKSIRFEGDLDKDVSEPIVEYSKLTLDVYEHSMKDLLYKTCCAYFEHAEKKKCRAIFPSLVDFLMKFGSEDMFVSVARSYKLGSGFALYDGILRGWLASDSMRSRALAQLIFIMSKTFSDRELELLFHSFQQMSPVAVEWCISLSLSPEMLVRPAASKWLRSALVKQTLLSLCRRGDEAGSRLVLDCLASYEGDLCVGEQTAQSIVSTLTDTVSPERCKLAADVCRALASTDFAETSLPLAMRIFDLALEHLSKDKDTYTEEEVEDQAEVETLRASVWQAVLDAWSSVAGPALCEVAIPAIYKHLLEDEDTLDTQLIERLVSLCPFLTDYDDIEDLIDQIFNIPIESSDTAVRTFALRQDCVYGRLSCPLETVETKRLIEIAEDNTLRDLERRDVVLFTRCLVLRAGFFKEVIADGRENDARLTNPISFDHVLMRLLEDTAIISSLCDGYAFANFYDILKQCKVYMDAKINDIIDTYDNDGEYLRHMLSLLLNKSTDVGFYWIQAYKLLKNRAHKALDLNLDTELMATVDVAMCSASNIKNWSQLEFSTRIDMLNEIVTQNGYYHILEGYKNKTQDADLKSSYFPMVRSWCVAHDLTSNAEENVGRREQFADKVHEALSTLSLVPIMDDYYKYGEKMFNDRDYTKESWRMTCCQSTLLDCLGAMVDSRGWDMDSHEWDFVNIVLCSVLTSLTLTPQLGCTKLAMITRPALKLFRSVITFVNNVREECVKREPRTHIAELPTEWRDIFAPTAFTDIVALLSHVLRSAEDTTMTVCHVATIDELIGAVRLINWDLTSAEKKQKEHSLDTLASLAIHVLSQDVPSAYKYLAFAAVRMLSKPLVLDDVEKLSQAGERSEREGDEDETIISLSLARYYDALRIQIVQLDGLLQEDSKIEDESVDKSALCSASLSFLLTALAALMQSELARGDLVHHYINSFGESELISCIVLVSMRLLPADVLRAASNDSPTAALSDNTLDHFTGDPKLSVHDADIMSIVHATSCRVLYSTMRAASGSVRSYWSSMSARRAATLRRIVIHAIAQPLIDEQLQHLRYHNSILEDAEVYIWRSQGGKHSRGECVVRCVATAEERALELAISLSEAHPLDPPRPVPVAAAPVPTHRLHFIRVYLAYQNGWVINALKMWTEMVRSRVESAAQCYICYCRLHPTTGKLPNVPCYTCNNRFHSHCLRKWFKTSKKSNCPLCRTVF